MTQPQPAYRFSMLGEEISFEPDCIVPADYKRVSARSFPIVSIAPDISGSCNLMCRYCAERKTLPVRPAMKSEVLKRALGYVFAQAKDRYAVSIHLGSGEPLLRPDLVRMIGEIAQKKREESGIPVNLHITTNGTLVTEDMVAHFRDYSWEVKISTDGPSHIHDANRPFANGEPTSPKVTGTIERLLQVVPDSLSTTSVLCHKTDPAVVFDAIAAMGVRNIELVPVALSSPSGLQLDRNDLASYCSFITDYVRRLAAGEDLPANIRFKKRLQRSLGFFNSSIACDAGRNFIAIGPDGTFYPCFRFAGLKEYRLGSLSTGISRKGRALFTGSAGRPYQERACKDCWASPLCGGPCFAVSALMCNGQPDPAYCSFVKAEAEAALYLAEVLRKKDAGRLLALAGIPEVVLDEDSAR